MFRVAIGDVVVLARHLVLDTGTRRAIPPIPGLDQVDFIQAGSWLDKPALPSHLAVLGGGYIGLEMSQLYRRLGSRVTVIEGAAPVAEHEDEEVAVTLHAMLEAEDIAFRLGGRLATNVPGIWAAGDIRGEPMFTHTAWDDYCIVLLQLAGDGSRTLDRVVPYAIFTDPELGRVGMTEAEAKTVGPGHQDRPVRHHTG